MKSVAPTCIVQYRSCAHLPLLLQCVGQIAVGIGKMGLELNGSLIGINSQFN